MADDYSVHTESKDSPTMYDADKRRGYGRGASTSDAAQRGRKDSPLQEAMPVTPEGSLAYGSYDK